MFVLNVKALIGINLERNLINSGFNTSTKELVFWYTTAKKNIGWLSFFVTNVAIVVNSCYGYI